MFQIHDEIDFHKDVIDSPQSVLVNFWSGWSDECRSMRRLMQALETELDERVKFVEVDWDLNKELALQYEVYGIPTLLIFYEGTLINRYSGIVSAEEVLEDIGL